MDPKRLVVISYLVFGFIIVLFVDHLLEMVLARIGVSNQVLIEGPDWRISTLVAGIITVAGLGYAWVNPKSKNLSIEVATELMRVTWPSWEETRISTAAVVIASLVAAVILFGIDSFSYKVMVEWLPAVWRNL
ncbi:MAG: preprotein translocase subunit SecE [Archangiaceae bacterium]|nr:preprotein translocase subunit SecE [Archangiaceae bacterium]